MSARGWSELQRAALIPREAADDLGDDEGVPLARVGWLLRGGARGASILAWRVRQGGDTHVSPYPVCFRRGLPI